MTTTRTSDGTLRHAAGSPASIGGQYAPEQAPAAAAMLTVPANDTAAYDAIRATTREHGLTSTTWARADIEGRFEERVGRAPTEDEVESIWASDTIQVDLPDATRAAGRIAIAAEIEAEAEELDEVIDGLGDSRHVRTGADDTVAVEVTANLMAQNRIPGAVFGHADYVRAARDLDQPESTIDELASRASDARNRVEGAMVEAGWDTIDQAIDDQQAGAR